MYGGSLRAGLHLLKQPGLLLLWSTGMDKVRVDSLARDEKGHGEHTTLYDAMSPAAHGLSTGKATGIMVVNA